LLKGHWEWRRVCQLAAAAARRADKAITPNMRARTVFGAIGLGGGATGEAASEVSAPEEFAAPNPPELETSLSSAKLLVERRGTETKANSRKTTPHFADRVIFIFSPRQMKYLAARNLIML
jgi:hypothetical protein